MITLYPGMPYFKALFPIFSTRLSQFGARREKESVLEDRNHLLNITG